MQEQKYEELETRTSDLMKAERADLVKKLEARSLIHAEIEKMRSEGKALTLSDEEFSLLESFRRFKLRMRKDGEMFSWQTRKPEGVQIVLVGDDVRCRGQLAPHKQAGFAGLLVLKRRLIMFHLQNVGDIVTQLGTVRCRHQ